jgi:hypothetical protein
LSLPAEPEQAELLELPDGEGDDLAGMTTAQLLLKFPDLAPPAFVPEECRKMSESKRYNGERFEREHPEACKWILKAVAGNLGYREIERMSGAKYYVVRALADRHKLKVNEHKRHLANMNNLLAEMATEKEMELVGDCKSLSQVSMTKGIAVDKALMLAGEPIMKLEINHKVDVTAKIDSAFNKIMEEFQNVKRAQVIEVEPEKLPA